MQKIVLSFLTALALSAVAPSPAPAQFYPDPINLGISNIEQEAENWHWPAIVRQVLNKRSGHAPSQCQIVNLANTEDGEEAPPEDCCQDSSLALCGRFSDIRESLNILKRFGVPAETVTIPSSPDQVYNYLIEGRALIVGFYIDRDRKHAYLVRGISWDEEGQASLLINDPAVTEPFQAPFEQERPGWQTVIAVN